MRRITIFVDESGTLPDPKDTVIVIAAVATANPTKFGTIIKEVQMSALPSYAGCCLLT